MLLVKVYTATQQSMIASARDETRGKVICRLEDNQKAKEEEEKEKKRRAKRDEH